jgi:hypothetical protein
MASSIVIPSDDVFPYADETWSQLLDVSGFELVGRLVRLYDTITDKRGHSAFSYNVIRKHYGEYVNFSMYKVAYTKQLILGVSQNVVLTYEEYLDLVELVNSGIALSVEINMGWLPTRTIATSLPNMTYKMIYVDDLIGKEVGSIFIAYPAIQFPGYHGG